MSINNLLSPANPNEGFVVDVQPPTPPMSAEDHETMRCDEAWKKLKVSHVSILICEKWLTSRLILMLNSPHWLFLQMSWLEERNVLDPLSNCRQYRLPAQVPSQRHCPSAWGPVSVLVHFLFHIPQGLAIRYHHLMVGSSDEWESKLPL
jgi:hypothetical protein